MSGSARQMPERTTYLDERRPSLEQGYGGTSEPLTGYLRP
ncbi:MAG: hypothetical protein JWP38_2803 [Herbaspirillum sp.]|jgi:hypothetical protein|nr:hypothetical protein [Herbaspirillum sp.]